MRRTINGRSLATYTAIAAIGLFLLALVSPSFGGFIPFSVFVVVVGILPLIAIVVALIYLWGNSDRSTKSFSRNTTKLVAMSAVVSIVLSVVITWLSTKQGAFNPHTLRYVFENIGVGFLYLGFAATLVVINSQKFVYWPFWNRSDKMNSDERQKTVRHRVFEKAYRWNLLVLFMATMVYRANEQRMADEVIQATILCLLGMPALIAAWQKDS